MLVTGKNILDKANNNNYAIGAFNVINMEMAKAVIEGASNQNSPIIIQTTEGAIKYAGIEVLSSILKTLAIKANINIAIHLDHGSDIEIIKDCIKFGYTSIMIDASKYELKTNIEKTKKIVELAKNKGISVEAELGRIGGVEDNIKVDAKDAFYTDPNEAELFVKETSIDSLAISIGTAHGQYKLPPKLNFEVLKQVKNLLKIPLVLHGASGVSDSDLKKAVEFGINKINIDTDLRIAFTEKLRETLNNNKELFDMRKYLAPSSLNVTEKVIEKIKLFGSSSKY